MGRTNLEILELTPFFSSRHLMVRGRVAELEAVAQAVVRAWLRLSMNLKQMNYEEYDILYFTHTSVDFFVRR